MPLRWCILSNLKEVFLIRFLTLLPTSILLVHRDFFFFLIIHRQIFLKLIHMQKQCLFIQLHILKVSYN